MAKDLPYFKFIISEWNDGDITLCSMEAQGLFVNLCSLYWSLEGELGITKAKRRFNGCNTTVWDELLNEKIIKLDGEFIVINFLDEQFRDRDKLSKTNSQNVAKRWQKQTNHTDVLPSYNDRIGSVYNIEEKREEKKRESITHGKGNLTITIKKVFAADKVHRIHDMKEYFSFTDQLQSLEESGWVHFEEFLKANSGKVFNEPDHLYNTFRNFCIEYKPPPKPKNKFEDAEYNKTLWTIEAWEEFYNWRLKKEPDFRKHFGYGELSVSKSMGGGP